MIDFLSTWAEQIIVAVIIASIIEMILPSGNNKKYIKAVIGVYILFTIISPILAKITNIDLDNLDYEKYFKEMDTSQTISQSLTKNNDKSIEEIYENNIKQDMKEKLKEQGYIVEKIELYIEFKNELNYGKISSVNLSVYKQKEEKSATKTNAITVNKIEKVTIGNTLENATNNVIKEDIKENEKSEIKKYISSVYEINKKSIKINE
ncbi:MAG: stage III sporulation protein AF [Clostridia bacterium]|nr:stage III sporulation protein AF [Clostridia bacterium]